MTESRQADERYRVAIHEAAHATVATALGMRVSVVSVRPAPTYAGICCNPAAGRRLTQREMDRDVTDHARRVPIILQQARVRHLFECDVVVLLAGPVADELFWPATSYRGIPQDEHRALEIIARLSPVAAVALAEAEAETGIMPTDWEKAAERADALAGSEAVQ